MDEQTWVEGKTVTEISDNDKCLYSRMPKAELLEWQAVLRKRYATEGPTHTLVEHLETINELLKKHSTSHV